MTQGQGRTSIAATIPTDLAHRLDQVAEERMVGKGLLVEKALVAFLDALPPVDASIPQTAPQADALQERGLRPDA